MAREILFRGKRVDNGEWVEGSLLQSEATVGGRTNCEIVGRFAFANDIGRHKVDPSTIGQYTGLTDKNGGRIWEGDLVRYEAIVKTDSEGNNAFFIGSIEYWSGSVGCGWRYKSGRSTMMIKTSHPWRMEVIGNIHEEREVKNG